ncbi:hypothetical protein GCM10010922_08900 [Microbacterium sorbitolivorans]|nr:hypothetical protein GCM10010922_08900 [Microbacterium sorbitolivorans]
MRPPTPLPPELISQPFAVADADELGVPRTRLRALDLRTPYRGVRSTDAEDPTDLLARCLEYAPRLARWQFFNDATALALLGAPLPARIDQDAIHVAAHRPRREPRIEGVTGHRLQRREPDWVEHPEGFRVESPVRALRQVGYSWPLDSLVAAADFLILPDRQLCTLDDLWKEVQEMGDMRGRILERALRLARVGSESPRESKLRLLLVRSGLPEPELNADLFDRRGTFLARLDMSYPQWKVAVEYDGRQHASDPRQFEKDADRWEGIRREGWRLVRILNHHMQGPTPEAPQLVGEALWEAGWRPRTLARL